MYSLRVLVMLFLVAVCLCDDSKSGEGWIWSCLGNCTKDTGDYKVEPSIVLMGGGRDVDSAFKWMISRASYGNILVLRSRGTDAYNPYIMDFGANSASTLIITSRVASLSPFVVEQIARAQAVWFAGGDQSLYVEYFTNNPIEQALGKKQILGGTSAGMAVLAGIVFSAEDGGITSREALADPTTSVITLVPSFLPNSRWMHNVLTDMHFQQRNRLGRLLVFMWRGALSFKLSSSQLRAISCDEQTAVLLDVASAIGSVVTGASDPLPCERNAHFFNIGRDNGPVPGTFHWNDVDVARVSPGQSFDFAAWTPVDKSTVTYVLNVVNETISVVGSRPSGPDCGIY